MQMFQEDVPVYGSKMMYWLMWIISGLLNCIHVKRSGFNHSIQSFFNSLKCLDYCDLS